MFKKPTPRKPFSLPPPPPSHQLNALKTQWPGSMTEADKKISYIKKNIYP